jgi:uncharacterized membrane protein
MLKSIKRFWTIIEKPFFVIFISLLAVLYIASFVKLFIDEDAAEHIAETFKAMMGVNLNVWVWSPIGLAFILFLLYLTVRDLIESRRENKKDDES